MKHELGSKAKDVITGFEGVVVARAEYLTGYNQALVQPTHLDNGKKVDCEWFDEQRLQRVDESLVTLDNGRTPGFDKSPPKI